MGPLVAIVRKVHSLSHYVGIATELKQETRGVGKDALTLNGCIARHWGGTYDSIRLMCKSIPSTLTCLQSAPHIMEN